MLKVTKTIPTLLKRYKVRFALEVLGPLLLIAY